MHAIAELDHRYIWHPFTQMRDWLKREPIIIVEAEGAVLRDARGREYLDANSSIWTNLHGHRHPRLNAAICRQLNRISHSSALGLGNEPASHLAEQLVKVANPRSGAGLKAAARRDRVWGNAPYLGKVFFSDDGSTAMEVALKLAFESARRSGQSRRPKFISLGGAYHGDTVGAMALGHNPLFHKSYAQLLFKTDKIKAPYCYRCPYNRARPERADAREYRKCNWECVGDLEQKFAVRKRKAGPYAAFVFEPLIQGAAGMIAQPPGWLRQAARIARSHGTKLIADEVMTAFGRTGSAPAASSGSPCLVACHQEGVQPDFIAVAKGLTGGYLPMAATLTTQKIFDAFLGEYEEFKTFFHGHSFTANQLGAAAALANLEILQTRASIRSRQRLERTIRKELEALWALPNVGDIRQAGLVVGVELVQDWRTRRPFAVPERAGMRVCEAMARRGVLTRPVGDVVVLMPPYCTTDEQAGNMARALRKAILEVLGQTASASG